MGIADLCALVGDDDIAEQRDGSAEARGVAVEPAHDGFFEIEQTAQDSPGIGQNSAEFARIVDHLLEPVHVAAGAEGSAAPGQDDEVAASVVLEFAQQPGKLAVHGLVHRVGRAAARQDDAKNAALPGKFKALKRIEIDLHGAGSIRVGDCPVGSCTPSAVRTPDLSLPPSTEAWLFAPSAKRVLTPQG